MRQAYPYAGTSRNGVSPLGYEPDVLRHAASVLLVIHADGYLQHSYQVYYLPVPKLGCHYDDTRRH